MSIRPRISSPSKVGTNPVNRDAQIQRVVEQAPNSVQNTLRQAFLGSASPRRAIKAMCCLSCVGYDRAAIQNCTGWSCPLWKYRPFQADEPQPEQPKVVLATTEKAVR